MWIWPLIKNSLLGVWYVQMQPLLHLVLTYNIFISFNTTNQCSLFFSSERQIDHSVVESFGEGGKTNILSRVYPQLAVANQAHLFVFNNGTEPISVENLKAWSMNPADIK